MHNDNKPQITIVDIKMPFISMVIFLVKLSIAAIPAFIILSFIFMLLGAVFDGFFDGFNFNMGMGRY